MPLPFTELTVVPVSSYSPGVENRGSWGIVFRPTLYDAGGHCSSAGGEDGDSDNDDEVEDGDGFTS